MFDGGRTSKSILVAYYVGKTRTRYFDCRIFFANLIFIFYAIRGNRLSIFGPYITRMYGVSGELQLFIYNIIYFLQGR